MGLKCLQLKLTIYTAHQGFVKCLVNLCARAQQNLQNDVLTSKTQIGLCIHAVRSVFAVRMKMWVLGYQTGKMGRLI